MKAKRREPCKCTKTDVDPVHTVEETNDGWTKLICTNCGGVKYRYREPMKDA